MEDQVIYDIDTGEVLQYACQEATNLIYHDGTSDNDFEFGAQEISFPEVKNLLLHVELHAVQGIENTINHYVNMHVCYRYNLYSHFFVLHGELCDVYIPGYKFLNHYSINQDLEYIESLGDRYNFWLLRFRYHRNMLVEAIIRFSVEEPFNVNDLIDVEHKECGNYVAIDTLTTIERVAGGDVLETNVLECRDSLLCSICSL